MKRTTIEIIKPRDFTIDEILAWNKEHAELREIALPKRSVNRHCAIRARIDAFTHQLMYRFKQAEENGHSHDQEIAYLKEWFYHTAAYRKLPEWAHRELDGVLSVLRKQQDRKLVWTHVLNGVRYASRAPELEGKLSQIEEKESAHCWLMPDGTFKRFN